MECACTVDVDMDCGSDDFKRVGVSEITALKLHSCHECNSIIDIGDWYFRESFISSYDGVSIFKTCEHCYSLRQVFFSSGWYYEMLWESMLDFIFECDGELSVTCINQLTPVAKGKVLDMMEEYFNETDDFCPKCGSLMNTKWSGSDCSKCGYTATF